MQKKDILIIPQEEYLSGFYELNWPNLPRQDALYAKGMEDALPFYEVNEQKYINYLGYSSKYRKIGYYIRRPCFERYYAVYSNDEKDAFNIIGIDEPMIRGTITNFVITKEQFRNIKHINKGVDVDNYFRKKEDISDPIERLYWELYEEGEDQ